MWELTSTIVTDRERIEYYLKGNYEPFAVTTADIGGERVWFRRYLPPEVIITGEKIEIRDQQPKPIEKPSRRVAPKTKG